MNTEHTQTKRELETKQARVAFLQKQIRENTRPAFQQLEAGFYMSAAAHLDVVTRSCREAAALLMDIQQLHFTLERLEAEQIHLPLGEEVPA